MEQRNKRIENKQNMNEINQVALNKAQCLAGMIFKKYPCIQEVSVCINEDENGTAVANFKKNTPAVPVLKADLGFVIAGELKNG